MRTAFILISLCAVISCKKNEPLIGCGCTDSTSYSYSVGAIYDNGTCKYSEVIFYDNEQHWYSTILSLNVDGVPFEWNEVDGVPDCNDATLKRLQLSDGNPHIWYCLYSHIGASGMWYTAYATDTFRSSPHMDCFYIEPTE
jgi:hypothetical protein